MPGSGRDSGPSSCTEGEDASAAPESSKWMRAATAMLPQIRMIWRKQECPGCCCLIAQHLMEQELAVVHLVWIELVIPAELPVAP